MPYLSLKVQAERSIVPFTAPKGQQTEVIGHFWGTRLQDFAQSVQPSFHNKSHQSVQNLAHKRGNESDDTALDALFGHLSPPPTPLITRQQLGGRGK